MNKTSIGRLLIFLGFGLLVILFTWETFAADEMRVIEVRRNIPLADNDPVYRDYYINAGLEAGLKPNQVVTAVRKINAKDAAGAQSFGELLIPVGQIKIIFAQSHLAVAREYRLLSRDDLPMLEQMGILIGDQVDLKGSFIDNRKSSAKTAMQKETATDHTAAVTVSAPVSVSGTVDSSPAKAPVSEAAQAAAPTTGTSPATPAAANGPAPASVAPATPAPVPAAKVESLGAPTIAAAPAQPAAEANTETK